MPPHRLLAAVGLLAVLCAVPACAQSAPPSPAALAAESSAGKACGGLPRFDPAAAGQIMAGKLTLSPFPAVTVDPKRDGAINWRQNPFHHPTWQQNFQSGGWIEMLIAGYLAGGPGARAYRARAEAMTRSWLKGVPAGSRDPRTVICLSEGFPGQAWIDDEIKADANYLATHWQGPWNHGLVQDLKLMRIGCAYPAGAFGGDALKWRKTADRQILSSFRPNRLGPSVDAQGVVNEQATGYEQFVYDLWRGGEAELAKCGYPLPPAIAARIGRMPAFLAEAGQPDGTLAQIGDTYAEHPFQQSVPPVRASTLPLVAVYQAGYIFGRSAWGSGGTFYSLRFGPARRVHGHDDHMGLTYFSRGRNLIVDAGHTGYEDSPYRDYLRSPEAASTFLAPGVKSGESPATSLTASQVGRTSQFYRFSDRAFGGPRSRSVYVHSGPDFVLVLDRGSVNQDYQQLWHLDPGLTVTSVTAGSATATAPAVAATAGSPALPATTLRITRIALPRQPIPSGSTTVVQGQTRPYQGWVSRQALQRTPAPVVIMDGKGSGPKGRDAAMLTLIAATAPGTPVAASLTVAPRGTRAGGPYRVLVRIGPATVPVTIW